MVRTHVIIFDDEHKAFAFVQRIHLNLMDIATFRDKLTVFVLDASPKDLEKRLRELARTSSASFLRIGRKEDGTELEPDSETTIIIEQVDKI